MRRLRKIFPIALLFVVFGLASCSDGPRRQVEYIVVNVTTDHVEGFRHNLRNAETGRPAFVHYPEIRFAKGDRIIMKRTCKGVTFVLASQPRF